MKPDPFLVEEAAELLGVQPERLRPRWRLGLRRAGRPCCWACCGRLGEDSGTWRATPSSRRRGSAEAPRASLNAGHSGSNGAASRSPRLAARPTCVTKIRTRITSDRTALLGEALFCLSRLRTWGLFLDAPKHPHFVVARHCRSMVVRSSNDGGRIGRNSGRRLRGPCLSTGASSGSSSRGRTAARSSKLGGGLVRGVAHACRWRHSAAVGGEDAQRFPAARLSPTRRGVQRRQSRGRCTETCTCALRRGSLGCTFFWRERRLLRKTSCIGSEPPRSSSRYWDHVQGSELSRVVTPRKRSTHRIGKRLLLR